MSETPPPAKRTRSPRARRKGADPRRSAPPAPVRYDERMSPSDALMCNIERDPMLRSTILCVMILDRPPDPDRFRIAVARSLQRVPRLRQRVALDPLGVAPPRWELDPHFDLACHVRRARVPGKAIGLAGSLARLLRPVREPLSPLLAARSLTLRLDAVVTTLAEFQRAGRAAGGTVNDAFVAAVTGGLRRYHEHHGRPVDALRMTMPINLREGEAGRRAGKQFAPARFAVPIAIVDPIERMREIRRLVAAQRAERALPLTEEISATIARLPRPMTVALFGSLLKAIDFITSNVPGPQFPVFAGGARVVRMFGYGPLSGAAANVTAFSYGGRFEIGVAMDHAAVPDPERFVDCLREGLDEVLAAA